jgi:hypothetical protein
MPTARDPRWILLAETGEYATLGRHREPEEAEIAEAEKALAKADCAGWLAIMSHSIHSRTFPELVMVRPLRAPKTPFQEAVKACQQRSSSGVAA